MDVTEDKEILVIEIEAALDRLVHNLRSGSSPLYEVVRNTKLDIITLIYQAQKNRH